MPLTQEQIARERKFVEAEKRRIAVSKPLTWGERVQLQQREKMLATEHPLVEPEEPLPEEELAPRELPYKPTAEELEGFKRGMEAMKFQVQQIYSGKPFVSDVVDNAAKTICVSRPMQVVVQRKAAPRGEKRVRGYEINAPPICRTIPAIEKTCIAEKENASPCEHVEQAYACSNDLSPTQATAVTDRSHSEVKQCIVDMEGKGEVLESPLTVHDEPVYTMPRDVAAAIREKVPVRFLEAES